MQGENKFALYTRQLTEIYAETNLIRENISEIKLQRSLKKIHQEVMEEAIQNQMILMETAKSNGKTLTDNMNIYFTRE